MAERRNILQQFSDRFAAKEKERKARQADIQRRASKATRAATSNVKDVARGAAKLPVTAFEYLRTSKPMDVARDVGRFAVGIGEDIAADPAAFVAEELAAPLVAARDFAVTREKAAEARAAGDAETADKLEQLAALAVVGGAPIIGKGARKAVKAGTKKAVKGAKKTATETTKQGVEQTAKKAPAKKTATPKAEKKKAIGTIFDDVTDYNQALEMARRGEHLRQDPTGQYVGGPRNLGGQSFAVNSPVRLGKFRQNYDRKLEAGLYNADWYDRARQTAADLSNIDLNNLDQYVGTNTGAKGELFARGTAAYSPQYTPPSEVNAFAKQHNAKVVLGQDIVPKTRSQAANVAKGYEVDPNTGRFTFTPENIKLGRKTGPYAEAKDPIIDPRLLYKTANDIWHGRALGFDQTGGRFDRAFTPQETNFLIGENLLAADRANLAKLAPGRMGDNGGPPLEDFDWTPRTAQAATWGTERFDSMLAAQEKAAAKYAKDMEAYKKGVAKWEAKGKPKGGKPKKPKEPKIRTEDEIREYAKTGIDTAVNRNLASVTGEYMPGFKVKQAPELFENNDLANEFSDVMAAATGPRDPTLEALQVFNMPIREIPGGYMNSANVFETNKGYEAPMLGSTYTPRRGAIEQGLSAKTANQKAGPQMDEATEKALRLSAMMHAPRHAQEGTGANMFIPEKATHRPVQLNAAEIAGPRASLEKAIDDLRNVPGLDVVDMQDIARITQFPRKNPLTPEQIQAGINSVTLPSDVSKLVGRVDSTGYWPSWGEEGSGQMTEQWLKDIDELGVPNVYERLNTPEFVDPIRRENAAREAIFQKYGYTNRADIKKFTDLLAQEGPKSIRDFVKKYGATGLPAILGVSLLSKYGLAAPSEEPSDDQY